MLLNDVEAKSQRKRNPEDPEQAGGKEKECKDKKYHILEFAAAD
jgi:hypothetical protein